jgi:hypothetical protein
MAGPLGVLPGAPAAAIIIVDEDVNAGPPWGCLSFAPSQYVATSAKKIVVMTDSDLCVGQRILIRNYRPWVIQCGTSPGVSRALVKSVYSPGP